VVKHFLVAFWLCLLSLIVTIPVLVGCAYQPPGAGLWKAIK
jgi:hypothetical protein